MLRSDAQQAAEIQRSLTSRAKRPSSSTNFGLPLDFIEDAVAIRGFSFDRAGFDAPWKSSARARRLPGRAARRPRPALLYQGPLPHDQVRRLPPDAAPPDCEVLAIIKRAQRDRRSARRKLKPGEHGEIVLDHTPFYADAGGQVGDIGWLYADDHNTLVADVEGVTYPVQGVRAHRVIAKQPIRRRRQGRRRWSTTKSAAPPCATTPARICFMPRCARCWAST